MLRAADLDLSAQWQPLLQFVSLQTPFFLALRHANGGSLGAESMECEKLPFNIYLSEKSLKKNEKIAGDV